MEHPRIRTAIRPRRNVSRPRACTSVISTVHGASSPCLTYPVRLAWSNSVPVAVKCWCATPPAATTSSPSDIPPSTPGSFFTPGHCPPAHRIIYAAWTKSPQSYLYNPTQQSDGFANLPGRPKIQAIPDGRHHGEDDGFLVLTNKGLLSVIYLAKTKRKNTEFTFPTHGGQIEGDFFPTFPCISRNVTFLILPLWIFLFVVFSYFHLRLKFLIPWNY